ncbi:MAG: hypothetical protein JKY46_10655 [Robiginitomaculum sp.]|nr:hypothetical protein [Robiginitomaculum sp.]
MTREKIKNHITESLLQVAEMHEMKIISPLTENTILLETGLDSLGFATLVASLEFSLGFDPYVSSEEAFYPQTFAEFIDFYHANQPK